MTFDAFLHQLPDADSAETHEWLESLDALVASEGTVRARFVIGKLLERARRLQVPVPSLVSTPYINLSLIHIWMIPAPWSASSAASVSSNTTKAAAAATGPDTSMRWRSVTPSTHS